MQELRYLRQQNIRIIVVGAISEEVAMLLLCESFRTNMTSVHQYVWFLPDWLAKSHSIRRTNPLNCTTKEINLVLDGHFAISQQYYAPDSAHVLLANNKIAVQQIKDKLTRQGLPKYVFDAPSHLGFVYDSVWLYALALRKCLSTYPEFPLILNNNEMKKYNMTCLTAAMNNTHFQGLSGHVQFASNSLRVSTNMDVRQWSNDTWIEVFSFRNESGHPFLFRKGDRVVWPNNRIPWDGNTSIQWKWIGLGVGTLIFVLIIAAAAGWIYYTSSDDDKKSEVDKTSEDNETNSVSYVKQ